MQFDNYTVVLLNRPENAPTFDKARENEIQDAHLHHLATMHESGELVAAGPFRVGDDEIHRGLCIFRCGVDETTALCAQDPAVIAGRLEAKILPWTLPSGAISFASTRFPHSIADVFSD
jgi:uncharacterized protein YciI